MIVDPIEIDGDNCLSRNAFFDKYSDLDKFVVRYGHPRYLGFLNQNILKQCTVHFAIINEDYAANSRTATREQFLDFVSVNYPDHFEWLLFHPEWL